MNADLALLVLRVVVGGIVMQHGLLKLGLVGTGGSVKGVSGWFDGMGLRPGLFWALVAIAAAGFAIALLGNGAWSLDGLLGLTYSDQLRWLTIAVVAAGVVLALGIRMALAPKKAPA
jgi:uncharacterized membrane protein YphA (DoxX/SURF4 family)